MAQEMYSRKEVALRWRRTRIIATLGPVSSSPSMIEQLIEAGVDLVRLNMSHGDADTHAKTVKRIRRVAKKAGRHIAILMDLCGPKIRVGEFNGGGIDLCEGQAVTITTRKVLGVEGLIPSQYRSLHKDIKPGENILLDDGKLCVRVTKVRGQDIECMVIDGGRLSDKKGMNLPNSTLSTPALTAKDRRDVQLGVELGVDFLALSFVRSANDVKKLARYLKQQGADIPIISKIERPEAVELIDGIIAASYGIMIARGDLGIELPAEKVPMIQRDLIIRARQAGVPVIVATQMLESMIGNSRPTRAEVTDVASAALLSADAAMLSGETAAGKYPIQAVKTMDRVLREVEGHQWEQESFIPDQVFSGSGKNLSVREAMAQAAMQMTRDLKMEAIIVPTRTGTTVRVISSHRPLPPTVGVCSHGHICRRMILHWGVVPVHIRESETRRWRKIVNRISNQCHLGRAHHDVLLVSGFNDDPKHNEPVLKVLHL